MELLDRRRPPQFGWIGGDDDDDKLVEPVAAQPSRHLPAARSRHGDVDQQQIGLTGRGEGQAFIAVGRLEDDEAQRRQQILHQAAMHRIVVGDQHGQTFALVAENTGFQRCGVQRL